MNTMCGVDEYGTNQFKFNPSLFHGTAGLGFSINLPVSSQSMLKSNKTSLILLRMMLVCTTLRWTPMKNSINMKRLDSENRGWSQSEVRKETCAVAGSRSQK